MFQEWHQTLSMDFIVPHLDSKYKVFIDDREVTSLLTQSTTCYHTLGPNKREKMTAVLLRKSS